MDEHIHIKINGAIAQFSKMPSPETLAMVKKLVEEAEKVVNKNIDLSDVSGQCDADKCKKCGTHLYFAMGSLFCPNPEC